MEFQKEEYEIQYYDFSLTDFIEQTKLMVEGEVCLVVKAAMKKIHEKDGCKAPESEEQKQISKVSYKISREMMKNMHPFTELVDKYLSIPDTVILPEDQKHDLTKPDTHTTEADLINLKIQSQALEAEVIETARQIQSLKEELRGYENVEKSFGDMIETIGLIESAMATDLHINEQKAVIKDIELAIREKID